MPSGSPARLKPLGTASAGRPVSALGLRLLEGYVELVATDYRLVHFLRNPVVVETGLFSLALGAKLRF